MKRLLGFFLLLAAAPLLAIEIDNCRQYEQLATLYEIRSLMLKPYSSSYEVDKVIDRRTDELRGPLPDGGFRWVRWVRPEGDAPYDKHGHTVAAVNGSDSDSFEASGQHAFSVRVAVPQKKSLFSSNNAVYVGTVRIQYTVDGRTRTKEQPIDAWMNPDTSRTIDLGAIADRVDASLDASTAAKDTKQALVEIHMMNAVARDDPANPAYDTIVSLQHLRGGDPDSVDAEIASLERTLFPNSDPLPLVAIVHDLREADDLIRSKKDENREKGEKLLRETLRMLR